MNAQTLVPGSYYWSTRLRESNPAFTVVFHWVAVGLVVILLRWPDYSASLFDAFLSYLAFLSLYEIGYMVNDLVVAPREIGGRRRGPQRAGWAWLSAWIVSRLIAFVLLSWWLGKLADFQWIGFFGGLCLVFCAHNWLKDKELKAGTFLWLSWYRFMAPLFFVVPERYLPGLAFACAMTYSAYRLFGYLDSKQLLAMPGRRRPVFRWLFFVWPVLAVPALWDLEVARGFNILVLYFAAMATLGGAASLARTAVQRESA